MTETRRSVLKAAAVTAAATILPAAARAQAAEPIVATVHGPVRGARDGGIVSFKGVRYGADTAAVRFQPPSPPAPWRAPLDATSLGPASPQRGAEGPVSEDCLFLNIWTPGTDEGRRPVMVYLHGGAYSAGSASVPLLDGTRLAARGDVVVVTLNHRLNLFGYAYLARFGGAEFMHAGNAGTLDILLALSWVRDNIAAFGGDPGNVTLFGQSGGGAKIATLMAVEDAQGLFHRAITMSGQQLTASGPLNATARTRRLLEALRVAPEDVAQLRIMPIQRLVEALDADDPIFDGRLYFGPVLDDRTLQRHPFYPDAPPQSAGVPMIIGNTHDETRSLIGKGDPSSFALTWDDVAAKLIAHMRVDIGPEIVVAAYRRRYPHYSPSDVFFAATTASRSWRAAIVEAELRAAQTGAVTYAYQLDFPSPLDGGKWGAPHTHDIALAFGNLDAPGSYADTSAASRAMSDRMMDAFIAFARNGDPNIPALPRWEPYTLPRRATMVFDTATRLEDDPRGAERRLFAKVPFIQQGT